MTTAAAAAAKAKFGTTEAEFNAVAELLGPDADDEDFCPTCLEAYTDGASQQLFLQGASSTWVVRRVSCMLCCTAALFLCIYQMDAAD